MKEESLFAKCARCLQSHGLTRAWLDRAAVTCEILMLTLVMGWTEIDDPIIVGLFGTCGLVLVNGTAFDAGGVIVGWDQGAMGMEVGEVRRLLARLRAEPRDALVALSNKKYRAVVAALPPATAPDDEEAWGRLCGDVLVFHAARLVLAGTPLPLRARG